MYTKTLDRFEVYYEGSMFADEVPMGEFNGVMWSAVSYGNWEDAIDLYNFLEAQGVKVELKDNEYGVILRDGEWY